MPASPETLAKVKKLIALAASPNPNEASAARAMADKFIAKYSITEEELASLDEKVYYGEDEKLFMTFGIVGWRQQLALCTATYFDCQIVQEEAVPTEGLHQFTYFVYGDDDQVSNTQFVYHAFAKKVEYLIDVKCLGRGPIYCDSFSEGVVEAIKNNIQMFGFDLPEIKKPLKKEEGQATPPTPTTMTAPKGKDEPTDKRVDVNKNSLIKDIQAYFKGLDEGKNLSLQDVLELEVENEEARRLQAAATEAPEHPTQQGSTEALEGTKD